MSRSKLRKKVHYSAPLLQRFVVCPESRRPYITCLESRRTYIAIGQKLLFFPIVLNFSFGYVSDPEEWETTIKITCLLSLRTGMLMYAEVTDCFLPKFVYSSVWQVAHAINIFFYPDFLLWKSKVYRCVYH